MATSRRPARSTTPRRPASDNGRSRSSSQSQRERGSFSVERPSRRQDENFRDDESMSYSTHSRRDDRDSRREWDPVEKKDIYPMEVEGRSSYRGGQDDEEFNDYEDQDRRSASRYDLDGEEGDFESDRYPEPQRTQGRRQWAERDEERMPRQDSRRSTTSQRGQTFSRNNHR